MSKKKTDFKSTGDIFKALASGLKVDKSENVVDWVLNNKIKTEDGYTIHYNERRYLVDLMNDMTPNQSIMASAQVSKTVSMFIKALYLNSTGKNTVISQPTQDLRDLLIKSKLNRIIENNEIFRHNVSGGLDMKTAFDRMLFLVYTFGNANVGYTVDVGIYDEVSRSNPQTIKMLKARQLDSKFKWSYYISNPFMPHDLLHNTFLNSDQKHWAIKPSCGCKRQILNWDGLAGYQGNVDRETRQFVCQYCRKVLEPQDIINGEWVKKFQNRENSGYWIHQMMRPTHTLEQQSAIVKEMMEEEESDKQNFWNFFMGLPYGGSEVNISKDLFMPHVISPFRTKQAVYMGLDIGGATGHHYVVGSGDTIFAVGVAKDWKEIRRVISDYAVNQFVLDQNPEYSNAVELQKEYPQNSFRCNFVGNRAKENIVYDDINGLVHVARNLVFDQYIQDIAEGKFKFAFHPEDSSFHHFMEQFCTLSKLNQLDGHGNPTFKWESPKGAWDHFAMAFIYSQVARHRLEQIMPNSKIHHSEANGTGGTHQPRDQYIREKEENDSWLDL